MKNKPDYWYNQSAVIPYRFSGDNVEVLIITTRKKKKWIFPKGIIEHGLSAKESAKKEAAEEAGVNGEVLPQEIGEYNYKKWGGTCKVKVFSLKVANIQDKWEENFRERKWIQIPKAKNYIFNENLIKILYDFDKLVNNF